MARQRMDGVYPTMPVKTFEFALSVEITAKKIGTRTFYNLLSRFNHDYSDGGASSALGFHPEAWFIESHVAYRLRPRTEMQVCERERPELVIVTIRT